MIGEERTVWDALGRPHLCVSTYDSLSPPGSRTFNLSRYHLPALLEKGVGIVLNADLAPASWIGLSFGELMHLKQKGKLLTPTEKAALKQRLADPDLSAQLQGHIRASNFVTQTPSDEYLPPEARKALTQLYATEFGLPKASLTILVANVWPYEFLYAPIKRDPSRLKKTMRRPCARSRGTCLPATRSSVTEDASYCFGGSASRIIAPSCSESTRSASRSTLSSCPVLSDV